MRRAGPVVSGAAAESSGGGGPSGPVLGSKQAHDAIHEEHTAVVCVDLDNLREEKRLLDRSVAMGAAARLRDDR